MSLDEDIEEVHWLDPLSLDLTTLDTYPAIRKLLKLYKKRYSE